MEYKVTNQIAPIARPGTRNSQVNRVFNAALGAFLEQGEGRRYDQLYQRYMGIAPRFRPRSCDCDPWVAEDALGTELRSLLDRGVLRFGYVPGAPYVYREEGRLTGFDHELGEAVVELIGERYLGGAGRLRAEWVEVELPSDEQADKLAALYQGLVEGDFDLALAGQMMLPSAYFQGLAIEWTAPTAVLFTAISYTGRDRDTLDVEKLKALRSGDLPAFEAWAAAESRRLHLELRVFSVVNPGPSPGAASDLVYALHQAGARAVWDTGGIADSDTVMLEATDHFAVGDSLASGAQSKRPGFDGIYLNIPATQELWPIAGFTATGAVDGPELAVYAEHSDSKKPMVLDPDLPARDRGWNRRVFNRVEVQRGSAIRLEKGTGVVTLRPGLYHITASSLVTYDDLAAPGRVTTDPQPFAGYSRLRHAADVGCGNEQALAIGTMSTANMLASLIDTWLEIKAEARIVLEHQVGNNVDHIYLQGIWEQSSWHVFARIAIQRVEGAAGGLYQVGRPA
jgi:hypothetical protein